MSEYYRRYRYGPDAENKAEEEKAGSRFKINAIKVGILLSIIVVIVIIVVGSSYIGKLMMKASSCYETMGLLITAGVLTAVVFIGLGGLLISSTTIQEYAGKGLTAMTAEEQYRYYRRQSDMLNL